MGFAVEGRDVTITGLGGDHGATPVWLARPVEVRRTPDTLVVATTDAARYSRLAVRAVAVVRRVVPGWDEPLVLEVPADARGPRRGAGGRAGDVRQRSPA